MTEDIEEEMAGEDEVAVSIPDDVLADIRQKHGEVVVCSMEPLGSLVFRRASQAINDRFMNKMSDSGEKSQALREFVVSCLVHPTLENGKPDFAAAQGFFRAQPNAVESLAGPIRSLGGKFSVKKL